jgi:[ribosomal protein S18]-alanine N-acetyltransferase
LYNFAVPSGHFQPAMRSTVRSLDVHSLNSEWLPAIVAFDEAVFGGFWGSNTYAEELVRSSGACLGITTTSSPTPQSTSLLAFGCVWHILDELHIILLGVHLDYRRQSLGLILLISLIQQSRARGMEQATLEVRASNRAAIALYEKVGFVTVGQRPKYYADTGEAALLMWCRHLQSKTYDQQLQQLWHQATDQLQRQGWAVNLDR